MNDKPVHFPAQLSAKLGSSIVATLLTPHVFHPELMPPRRLALVFGRPGDEKEDFCAAFLHCKCGIPNVYVLDAERQVDTIEGVMRGILPSPEPTVYIITHFEWCMPLAYFSELQKNILSRLPATTALICVTDIPPVTPEYAHNAVTARFWAQFEPSATLLFDLPEYADLAARLHWNFTALGAHCQATPELAHAVSVQLTAADYEALSRFGNSHILADVDDFCKRVNYAVLDRAMGTHGAGEGKVVVNLEYVESFLTPIGKERMLANRDVAKKQNEYNAVVGKQPSCFSGPPPVKK